MPRRWPTARAVVRPSPVAITTRRPAAAQRGQRIGRRRLDRVGHGRAGRRARPSTARCITLAPWPRSASACARQRATRRRRAAASARCCPARAPCRRPCRARRCPDSESNCSGLSSAEPALAGRGDDGRGQRVLAALVEAGGQAQHLVLADSPARRPRARTPAGLRSACRSCRRSGCRPCAGSRSPRRRGTARRCVAPRPVATMIDIGVARPSAQGQAMISTATALIRP